MLTSFSGLVCASVGPHQARLTRCAVSWSSSKRRRPLIMPSRVIFNTFRKHRRSIGFQSGLAISSGFVFACVMCYVFGHRITHSAVIFAQASTAGRPLASLRPVMASVAALGLSVLDFITVLITLSNVTTLYWLVVTAVVVVAVPRPYWSALGIPTVFSHSEIANSPLLCIFGAFRIATSLAAASLRAMECG